VLKPRQKLSKKLLLRAGQQCHSLGSGAATLTFLRLRSYGIARESAQPVRKVKRVPPKTIKLAEFENAGRDADSARRNPLAILSQNRLAFVPSIQKGR
jgi:hypothetical protein